ncbi:hypothetical protein ACOCJ4_07215 [Knoellia sp. CPCC 206435]|uniref:hypothetical protein n=1 Tax=Knoellia terrae TaxID=3404797 RepID=UPI003B433E67
MGLGELVPGVVGVDVLEDGLGLTVAEDVGEGEGVALGVADGLGLADVVGLGAGVVSATAADGIPRVSARAASGRGASTRRREVERRMWGTAFSGAVRDERPNPSAAAVPGSVP